MQNFQKFDINKRIKIIESRRVIDFVAYVSM